MNIYVNDISFKYKFFEKEDFIKKVNIFINVCKTLESDKCSNVKKVLSNNIDTSFELINNHNILSLVNMIADKDKKRYFLSLIINRDNAADISEYHEFVFDDKKSYICSYAKDEGVVSLLSSNLFDYPIINGTINQACIDIINIATNEHINIHRALLGIRTYHANDEKHKKNKENYYGGKSPASPMDLTDDEAQKLLNKAIEVNGRLYAKKNGNYYAFQKEQDIIFHGYQVYDLGDNILKEINKKNWD